MKCINDGVDIYILPDCAKCTADNKNCSPLELLDCPLGKDNCYPGECEYYEEDY